MLAEIAEHRAQDQIIKGTYGQGSNGDWKGCAVGCSIHSYNRKRGTKYSAGDHAAYESALGIPRSLAYLEDTIFENLPDDLSLDWPKRFMEAPKVGADLSLVTARFMVWLLADENDGVIRFAGEHEVVRSAILAVAALYQRQLDGGRVSDQEWSLAAAWEAAAAAAAAAAARSGHYVKMADKLIELMSAA